MEKVNSVNGNQKEWITEALLSLMKEKTFSEITVQEITEKADLVVKSFYHNFGTKEDVLKEHTLEIMKRAYNEIVVEGNYNSKEMCRVWLIFLELHEELFKVFV